jgi:hypothetical protein
VRIFVNQMKLVVQIRVEEENVFKNFGCVMVIGKKLFFLIYSFNKLILVIVMMEVMKNNVIVV